MSWFTLKRLTTAAAKAGLVAFASVAGERLARKYINPNPPGSKRRPNQKRKQRRE